MIKQKESVVGEVRERLVEIGGRTTQDLGLGRIVGQVLAFIYLADHECSLDEIGEELGLSKAAVSIAARQLEGLGLLQRVWKKGDRKNYYKIVRDFGAALRKGFFSLVRNKVDAIGGELDNADDLLQSENGRKQDEEFIFVSTRVKRARNLRDRVTGLLENPIVRLLEK